MGVDILFIWNNYVNSLFINLKNKFICSFLFIFNTFIFL